MRVVEFVEVFEPGDQFRLWGLGDFHLGAPDCDEDQLRRHVRTIAADTHARWIGMGDYGDLIDPRRDHRGDSYPIPVRYRDAMFTEGGIPMETVAHTVEILTPIKEKCIGFIGGNHEEKIRREHDISLDALIAEELEIRNYLGYEGCIHWRFRPPRAANRGRGGTSKLTIHVHHGWQAGRRSGAKLNQAQIEKSEFQGVDVLMRGHAHERIAKVFDGVSPGRHYVHDAPWVYICTGSYKLGRVDTRTGEAHHTTWEERRGFTRKSRSRLGPPILVASPSVLNGKHPTEARVRMEILD